jgi:hypothetical protein
MRLGNGKMHRAPSKLVGFETPFFAFSLFQFMLGNRQAGNQKLESQKAQLKVKAGGGERTGQARWAGPLALLNLT